MIRHDISLACRQHDSDDFWSRRDDNEGEARLSIPLPSCPVTRHVRHLHLSPGHDSLKIDDIDDA